MAKNISFLPYRLEEELNKAVEFVTSISAARAENNFSLSTIEFAYELSYLRGYLAWEDFLQNVFVRLLCGYKGTQGCEPLKPAIPAYFSNIALAEANLLGSRAFLLWHDPTQILTRHARFFLAGNFSQVISSAQSDLESCAAVRHRIAHSQNDARNKFDAASMNLAGRRCPGGRPGRLLKDWSSTSPPRRFIDMLFDNFVNISKQICL